MATKATPPKTQVSTAARKQIPTASKIAPVALYFFHPTLGTIGFEGRFDYAAIGTVSNVASRLCDEAKPGQILISPRVLMAVEKDIAVEPIGDFALKGIRRPLKAYNVLSTVSANSD